MPMRISLRTTIPCIIATLLVSPDVCGAQKLKLCKKGNSVYAAKKCGKGGSLLKLSGLTGQQGEDGTLGVYGDGSAGPLTLAAGFNEFLVTPPGGNNLQFTTCDIPASSTLTVPSGTIIRCSESANIAGSLTVMAPSNGGRALGTSTGTATLFGSMQAPGTGISLRPAGVGELARANAGFNNITGGLGGTGYSSGYSGDPGRFLASLLRVAHLSGGGGAAPSGAGSIASSEGGRGGGSVIIIAKKTITISGIITADAFSTSSFLIHGAGGGGGGVVILAAGTSIAFSGSGAVQARGSNGDQSGTSVGPGGGGGGGVIQYISASVPTITSANSQVTGGSGGASTGSGITSTGLRQGGGGGGGSAGSGGDGGFVPEHTGNQTASYGSSGEDGIATAIVADPAPLLLGL